MKKLIKNTVLIVSLTVASVNGAKAERIPSFAGGALLGGGYNSTSEELVVENCFEGKTMYSGSPSSTLGLKLREDLDQVYAELGMKVAGKFSLEVISAEGAAEFFASIEDDRLSINQTFKFDIQGKSAKLSNIKLNKVGKAALASALEEATAEARSKVFYAICGDRVITEIGLGGSIIVTVRFNFSNLDIKTRFKQKAKVSFADILSGESETDVKLNAFKENMTISIDATQIGGNPNRLASILGVSIKDGVMSEECGVTPEKRKGCIKFYQNIKDYVANTSTGFVSQLEDLNYQPGSPNGPASLSYHIASIDKLAISSLKALTPSNPLADAVIDNRQHLIEEYLKHRKDLRRAQHLLRHGNLDEKDMQKIGAIKLVIEKNISLIGATLKSCREDVEKCLFTTDNLSIADYKSDDLIKDFKFIDYCQMPDISDYTQHTVDAIKASLALNLDSADINDKIEDCAYLASQVVPFQAELTLKAKDKKHLLHDMRPLNGFDNLRILDVSNNNIVNIDFLKYVPNLVELNARANAIGSPRGISNVPSLVHLNLSFNRLKFTYGECITNNQSECENPFDEFKALTQLKSVRLYGNDNASMLRLGTSTFDNLSNKILTGSELCKHERNWLYSQGKINRSRYEDLKTFGGFNDFTNPQNPDDTLTEDYFPCGDDNINSRNSSIQHSLNYYFIVERPSWKNQLPPEVK